MSISIKTEKEIEYLREAGKSHVSIINGLKEFVYTNWQDGISTMDIELKARELFKEQKAIPAQIGYHGYKDAICSGINDDAEHCIPSAEKIIKSGDLLTIDTVTKKMGYHADGGLTLAIGDVDELSRKLLQVGKTALMAGVNACVVGNRVNDISNAIADVIKGAGFNSLINFAAHGIGREMHEEPDILNFHIEGNSPKLMEGMVFALDTMVTTGNGNVKFLKDGWSTKLVDGSRFGFFEYTVVVRKENPEIITPFALE
jgi:methionyl aminopeptidase